MRLHFESLTKNHNPAAEPDDARLQIVRARAFEAKPGARAKSRSPDLLEPAL